MLASSWPAQRAEKVALWNPACVVIQYSLAKRFNEKNWSQKSRDTVPLIYKSINGIAISSDRNRNKAQRIMCRNVLRSHEKSIRVHVNHCKKKCWYSCIILCLCIDAICVIMWKHNVADSDNFICLLYIFQTKHFAHFKIVVIALLLCQFDML